VPVALPRPWASLRRLLAERSRRGRGASYALAALAIVAAAWALYTFFPRRPDPSVELRLPLPAAVADTVEEIRLWPDMPFRVTGADHTDRSTVELELGGRRLGQAVVDQDGRFRAAVRVPRGLDPGVYAFVARDRGSGKVTAREDVVVEDRREPALAMQPDTVAAGDRIAVTGGGFPGRTVLHLILASPEGPDRRVGQVRTRPNGLVFAVVAVPPDLRDGPHSVTAMTRAGAAVGRPGRFEVDD
jgi:hypothetical protein